MECAARAGMARSRLQHLEDGGNTTVETLERVIRTLPALSRLTLGGVEFIAPSRLGVDDAIAALSTDLARLTGLVGVPGVTDPSPVNVSSETAAPGATRHESQTLDPVTRKKLAAIEADRKGRIGGDENS